MVTKTLSFQLLLLSSASVIAAPIDTPHSTHSGLDGPAGVAWLNDGLLLVTEADTGTVQLAGPEGLHLLEFGELSRPSGLDVDAHGQIFIAETGRHQIVRFERDGTRRGRIGSHGGAPGQLRLPLDVDVRNDRVVIADTGNDRVQIFTPTGEHLLTIGRRGTEPGQFRRPSSVAQFADGRIAVADTDNHRIQLFAPDGSLLHHWGDRGSHPGLFAEPTGIEVDGDIIRVVDRLNHRIQSFTDDGTFLHAWGMHALRPREGDGRIHYPTALAVSRQGQMAVAEQFEERVQIFEPHDVSRKDDRPVSPARGSVQSHFGPVVALDDRILIVWEPESQVVLVFDHARSTPIRLTSIWSSGTGVESFGRLSAIHWDHDAQRLHMLDAATGQMHEWAIDLPPAATPRFDPDMGRLLSTRPLPAAISADRIVDAVRADDGTWFMLDAADDTVHVLDESLEHRGSWPAPTEHPIAIALDPARDSVLILGHDDVHRTDADGTVLDTFALTDMQRPAAIAVSPDSSIHITDTGLHQVRHFDAAGTVLATLGRQGVDHAEFWRPAGIAADANGHIFVLDHGNHRCQIFTPQGQWRMSFGAGRAYTPQMLPLDHPLNAPPTP
jgi:DNA-binding beta-propeller fold protein YncE